MKGNHLPVDPDIRALEIGANVIKVKSFPLMPESEPWNLKSWFNAALNCRLSAPSSIRSKRIPVTYCSKDF